MCKPGAENQKSGKPIKKPKKPKTKDQGPQKGRCQNQAFEVIINDYDLNIPLKDTFEAFINLKHGIYRGFAVPHTKEGKTHVHMGLILREKPRDLKWTEVTAYFKKAHKDVAQTDKLKDKSKCFKKKLQTYYDYTQNEEYHEGETIEPAYLYRWEPQTKEDKLQKKPELYIHTLIFEDLSIQELNENIDGHHETDWLLKTRMYALKNYDNLSKMIEKLQDIRDARNQAELYEEKKKTYRPFQAALTTILDDQNDRNIHCHYDGGLTGKNYFVDVEGMRPDTLILQSAETKRIAFAWNPKIHKRIIFDIPKHKMKFVNTSVIEKLKNGTLFSSMHRPKMKKSLYKPSILLLGNERVPHDSWTGDRATYSSTSYMSYEMKMETEFYA